MARARLFKPGFFSNADLAEIPAHGRLLFVSLWTLADREGRLKDDPRVIKGTTFPFENPPVEKLLSQLADRGFITRYEVDGKRFIQVENFLKHQRPHQNEPASTFPPNGEGLAPMYEGLDPLVSDVPSASSSDSDSESDGDYSESKSKGSDAEPVSLASLRDTRTPSLDSPLGGDWDFALWSYRSNVGPLDDKARAQLLSFWERLDHDWVLAAINETATCAEPGFGYLLRILERCLETNTPPSSLAKTRRRRAAMASVR